MNIPLRQSHILPGVRGQTVQQVVEKPLEDLLTRWDSIGGWVRLVLDQPLSPPRLPAISPCQAVCRRSPVETAGWDWQRVEAWLGAEVARLSWSTERKQSQQTTSTYWAEEQLLLCSLHVGKRGSQAVCESVWSESLDISPRFSPLWTLWSVLIIQGQILPQDNL